MGKHLTRGHILHPANAVAATLALTLALTSGTQAASITVDGVCTLTDAIIAANTDTPTGSCPAGSGDDTITLDTDVSLATPDTTNSSALLGSYAGLPTITSNIVIQAGAGSVIERTAVGECVELDPNQFRLLHLNGGNLVLSGLTLRNGCSTPDPGSYTGVTGGGAILVQSGNLVLGFSVLLNNTVHAADSADAARGGAVLMLGGTLQVSGGNFTNNSANGFTDATGGEAQGGAIYLGTGVAAAVQHTLFNANAAVGGRGLTNDGGNAWGGAVYLAADAASTSWFSSIRSINNLARGGDGAALGGGAFGGGIASQAAMDGIARSQFFGNVALGGDGDTGNGGVASGGALWTLGVMQEFDWNQLDGNATRAGRSTQAVGGTAAGGAVHGLDALTLGGATFSNNRASGGRGENGGGNALGGAIYLTGGQYRNLTLFGNTAAAGDAKTTGDGGEAKGGGLYSPGSAFTLQHATVASNSAVSGAGDNNGVAGGGGLWIEPGGGSLGNSALADNSISPGGGGTAPSDCATGGGNINSLGYNIIAAAGTGCAISGTGDQTSVDPLFGPLADYGCSFPIAFEDGSCLQTVALDLASPAVDAGNCTVSSASDDARDLPRPADLPAADVADGCDIGAYEARPIRYVNVNVVGGAANGSSWADAFPNLHDALATASAGDEFWLAEGAYFPDVGTGVTDNDVVNTFLVPAAIRLLGGFTGTETQVADRDWMLHPTVLSGDIDGDDAVDGHHITRSYNDIAGSNSLHVMTLNVEGTLLDGLTLTGGSATGPLAADKIGSALYCNTSNLEKLRNMTVIGNRASNRAAMWHCSVDVSDSLFEANRGDEAGSVSATDGSYRRTTFRNNSAGTDAAVFYLGSGTLRLTDALFEGNQSGGAGAVRSQGDLLLDNVLFRGNRGSTSAAIELGGSAPSILNNVTVTGNHMTSTGGAIRVHGSADLRINNSILWNNQDAGGTGALNTSIENDGSGTVTLRTSVLQGSGGSGAWSASPMIDAGGNLDQDPQFVIATDPATAPTTTGDSHILATSPAFDSGDDGAVQTLLDLEQTERIQSLAVDMGAYETPFTQIGDRVWLDDDKDGIQDPGEAGFAGISLTLFDDNDLVIDSAITDADGAYHFDWVPPGSYYLSVTLPAGHVFSPQQQGGDATLDSDVDATGISNVFAFAYQIDQDLDAGIVCSTRALTGSVDVPTIVICDSVTLADGLAINAPLAVSARKGISVGNSVTFAAGAEVSLSIVPL